MTFHLINQIALVLTALLLLASQPIRAAEDIPFTMTVIDAENSGDEKAVADIDNDGFADGILGGSTLVWYDSGHEFAKHVIRSSPVYSEFTTDMQAVDIDGDGDADLILGDGDGADNVLWFENPLINPPAGLKADPTVGANWTYHVIGTHGATTHDIEIGDLNNDGKLDVVTSGHTHLHVWLQKTPTSWQDKDLSNLDGRGISLGDIDGDGSIDIATPNGWLQNPGDPLGEWTRYLISNVADTGDEVLLSDLNGNGKLELMSMNAHDRAEIAWFEPPADPTSPAWTKHVLDPAMGAHHPEIADFNNDGKPDILLGLELADLSIYLNNGEATPTFTKDQIDTTAGHNARAGDLNGDGKIDIFAADYIDHPPVRVYLNQGDFASGSS